LAYKEVIVFSTSFRYDGFGLFVFLAALTILLRTDRPRVTAAAAGLLTAVGLLVTLKSAFYLPTLFAGLLLRRYLARDQIPDGSGKWPGWRSRAADVVTFILCTTVAFVVLYMLHRVALAPQQRRMRLV
jgi:hypothetical protein